MLVWSDSPACPGDPFKVLRQVLHTMPQEESTETAVYVHSCNVSQQLRHMGSHAKLCPPPLCRMLATTRQEAYLS